MGHIPFQIRASSNPSKFFIKATPNGVLIFRATATVHRVSVTSQSTIPRPQTFLPVPIEVGYRMDGDPAKRQPRFPGIQIPVEATNAATGCRCRRCHRPGGNIIDDCLKVEQQLQTAIIASPRCSFLRHSSTMWLAPDFGLVQSLNSSGVPF